MKTRKKYLMLAIILLILCVVILFIFNRKHEAMRERRLQRQAEIIESYRKNALLGIVPWPANRPNSVRCNPVDYDMPFSRVIVMGNQGEEYHFIPEEVSHGVWHFKLYGAVDANGQSINLNGHTKSDLEVPTNSTHGAKEK